MTVADAVALGRTRLAPTGDEGRFDALRILEEIAGQSAAWIFANGDRVLDDVVARSYARAIERRANGEPVAYIVGNAGFYGRTFAVTSDVLVPRPESEMLVEFACEFVRGRDLSEPRICDVGTGSGILAVTLACELATANVTAIDISPSALAVAAGNAATLGVATRVRFARGDLFAALDDTIFDCIVANLPYIRSADLAPRPTSIAREPMLALDGGPDGLGPYRALLGAAPQRLAAGGAIFLEAGADTTVALAELAAEAFGRAACVHIHRDYAGHPRVVDIRT